LTNWKRRNNILWKDPAILNSYIDVKDVLNKYESCDTSMDKVFENSNATETVPAIACFFRYKQKTVRDDEDKSFLGGKRRSVRSAVAAPPGAIRS
jgi:hypothetical protein